MGILPSQVNLGGVPIGDGFPTAVVAEIGTFFNQDIELAREYIKAAVAAGAPILKSEVLHDADVCLRDSGLVQEFSHAGGLHHEEYRRIVERKAVPLDHYEKIYGLCLDLRVPYIATVYDKEGIHFLKRMGAAGIKISRDNINNIPMIRCAAQTGLPLVFDAGVVYLDEIARAVRIAQDFGAGGVIVNHHPGANPAPPESHNLRVVNTYKEALGVPVGLSCHYRGDEILYVAVGMGCNLLEKGVDKDPNRLEQDLVSAAPLSELKMIIQKVQNCWQAMGNGPLRHKEPRDFSRRKGIVTKKPVSEGELLTEENLGYAWPPVGISVDYWDLVIGQKTECALDSEQPIGWADVRFAAGSLKSYKGRVTRA